MVIYLRWRKEIFFRIIIIIFLIASICLGGYYASYLKYNDKKIVDLEALRTQNRLLQKEIEEINGLKTEKGEYIIGKVILRNMHDFFGEVVINLGSNDGVKKNDAVLNSEGLVGVVYRVEENKSFVKLLSSDFNVSVKINDTYGNLNKGKVNLLSKYSDFHEGDKVYTSGYSGLQEGIFVGTIKEVFMEKNNLGKEVSVELVDNTNLNYVSVIRSST